MTPNMTSSFCSFPNECVFPNCNCADVPLKPTIKQQLAWLDAHGDNDIIRAIKENVIAVRNYEKALDNELRPGFIRDRDQAFNELLAYGEVKMMTLDEIVNEIDKVPNSEVNYELLKTYAEGKQYVEALDSMHLSWTKLEQYNDVESCNIIDVKPFVFRADSLNPREELAIDNRIKQLQGELRFELSRKKQFRSQQVIDHCHTSINNLKKWKSQSF